ncbi:hypothetical protein MGWOODY_Smn2417 [hydrothermal vent metagenome]|uniref:Uncharacterized protein n=1 Tax=hydrothermal vent metagenome TaxID=652676 RepID=A0A160TGW9_9ZZZZ
MVRRSDGDVRTISASPVLTRASLRTHVSPSRDSSLTEIVFPAESWRVSLRRDRWSGP